MADILQVTIIFAFCFFCHSLIHRFLKLIGIRTFLVMIVYPIGFIVCLAFYHFNIHVLNFSSLSLPITSLVWFCLLSVIMSIFYFPVVVAGAQTPADIILSNLQIKPRTRLEILSLFSYDLLIDKRIDSLQQYGFISTDKTKKIFLTNRGSFASHVINLTKRVLGISVGG